MSNFQDIKETIKAGDLKVFKAYIKENSLAPEQVSQSFLAAVEFGHLSIVQYIANNLNDLLKTSQVVSTTINTNEEQSEEVIVGVKVMLKHSTTQLSDNVSVVLEAIEQAVHDNSKVTLQRNPFNQVVFSTLFACKTPIKKEFIDTLKDMGFKFDYNKNYVLKHAINENLDLLLKHDKNLKKDELIISTVNKIDYIILDDHAKKRLEHFYKLNKDDAKNFREDLKSVKKKMNFIEIKKSFSEQLTAIQEKRKLSEIDLTNKPKKILKL